MEEIIMTKLDLLIIISSVVFQVGGWLYLRFAPTYLSDRSKWYIQPPRKEKFHVKDNV
jgi:hypothetical protein